MFPITTFDAGRRPGVSDSAHVIVSPPNDPEQRTNTQCHPERSVPPSAEREVETRVAVLTFTETIERTSDATELILHS